MTRELRLEQQHAGVSVVWNMCVHHILDDVDQDEDCCHLCFHWGCSTQAYDSIMVYDVDSEITNNETRVDCEHVSNTPVTVF